MTKRRIVQVPGCFALYNDTSYRLDLVWHWQYAMLLRRHYSGLVVQCRRYSNAAVVQPKAVPTLSNGSLETFRKEAWEPATPALLPRGTYTNLPAVRKWFTSHKGGRTVELKTSYFSKFSAIRVPVEITNNDQFVRTEQPLGFFLECVYASTSTYDLRPARYFSASIPGARMVRRTTQANAFFSASTLSAPTARVYLAQASLADFPVSFRNDLPTPKLVLKAGRGDVYDTSIWLGQAPTYTPLHRDPNPNLFVQLAGTKHVRLFPPTIGNAIFAQVQERIGGSANATIRGEEMMQGVEKKALEEAVWGKGTDYASKVWQAELGAGDGLFVPKGWWHSIRGIGEGMNGSVNWWFR